MLETPQLVQLKFPPLKRIRSLNLREAIRRLLAVAPSAHIAAPATTDMRSSMTSQNAPPTARPIAPVISLTTLTWVVGADTKRRTTVQVMQPDVPP